MAIILSACGSKDKICINFCSSKHKTPFKGELATGSLIYTGIEGLLDRKIM